MDNEDIRELLQRLSATGADAAWREFLARYSPLLMRVVRHYETSDVESTDCFVHVCGALSDERFRRLRAFRTDGTARFDTWLRTVASNLCVDWRRKQRGRVRMQRSLSRLTELEQGVYRCLYVVGMPRAECLHALQARFPDLTGQRLSEINARLFSQLSHQQRWRALARARIPLALGASTATDDDPAELQIPDPGSGPDEQAQDDEVRRRVEAGLRELPPQQRLLLRMRYEQDLTLAQIARLTGQQDTNRVYRQLEAAVAALRKLVNP
jgi:RNA polymerase sigma factor (sigma-70 family)